MTLWWLLLGFAIDFASEALAQSEVSVPGYSCEAGKTSVGSLVNFPSIPGVANISACAAICSATRGCQVIAYNEYQDCFPRSDYTATVTDSIDGTVSCKKESCPNDCNATELKLVNASPFKSFPRHYCGSLLFAGGVSKVKITLTTPKQADVMAYVKGFTMQCPVTRFTLYGFGSTVMEMRIATTDDEDPSKPSCIEKSFSGLKFSLKELPVRYLQDDDLIMLGPVARLSADACDEINKVFDSSDDDDGFGGDFSESSSRRLRQLTENDVMRFETTRQDSADKDELLPFRSDMII